MEWDAKAKDVHRVGASTAEANALSRHNESNFKQYEFSRDLPFCIKKANNDAITHANDAKMEAAKVMLATAASQQVASSSASVQV